jgi:hypothetical protein
MTYIEASLLLFHTFGVRTNHELVTQKERKTAAYYILDFLKYGVSLIILEVKGGQRE